MTKFPTVRALLLTFAAAAALTAAAPALAQTNEEPATVSVRYADLDINHAAGAKVLIERIENASVRACGGAPDIRELQVRAVFDKCHDSAFNRAVTTLDAPVVTAIAGQPLNKVRLASR
jgi:UrcA family protein